jgi:hypothetical protein
VPGPLEEEDEGKQHDEERAKGRAIGAFFGRRDPVSYDLHPEGAGVQPGGIIEGFSSQFMIRDPFGSGVGALNSEVDGF